MKKTVLIVALTALVAGGLFAAGNQESVTVEGKLAVVENVPTVTSSGKTWIIPPQMFYRAAWLSGIKAGDTLKIEGYEVEPREDCEVESLKSAKVIVPSKVSVNGKALDLTSFDDMRGGRMGGRMAGDDEGRGRGGMMDGGRMGGGMMGGRR